MQSSNTFWPTCKINTYKTQQPSLCRHSQQGAGPARCAGQACTGRAQDPPDAAVFAVHAHPAWFWAVRLRPLRRQTLRVPPWSPVTAAWPSGAQAAAVSGDSLRQHRLGVMPLSDESQPDSRPDSGPKINSLELHPQLKWDVRQNHHLGACLDKRQGMEPGAHATALCRQSPTLLPRGRSRCQEHLDRA